MGSATAVAVVASTLSAATLLVAARMGTRLLSKRVGVDDWAIVAAWVFTCGTGIVISLATQHGLGSHISTLPMETVIEFLKHLFALIILYNIALALVKVSFLLQYRRVFASSSTVMRIACDIGLVIVVLWAVFQVLVTVFFCKPTSGFWDISIQPECQPRLPFWISNSVFNLLTDLAIFTLPLPSLARLHLGKVQKRILIGVFCLGFFTCIISIIRLTILKSVAESTDQTFDNVSLACWSIGELVCGIISACVPPLQGLLARLFPRLTSWSRTSEGYEIHTMQMTGFMQTRRKVKEGLRTSIT
ncbi:hypothetical protein B0I37DRAFT_381922 [Chaetomium sp. MPI-CAGE-AT-0009]|nr:hypothetical protein B0I37DRAFT_381922 [Chaetomium sp. MPI-CAGE-AT-0009]